MTGALRPILIGLLGLALAVGLSACGTDSRVAGLPHVQVRDLDGPTVDLATLSPRDKPLLVWIWAPF